MLAVINYIREQMLRCYELKNSGNPNSKLDSEESRYYNSGKLTAYTDILRKLVENGITFEPDTKLIAEAETLIPKGPFYCNHELNRILRYYKQGFKEKNYFDCVLNERTIRMMIVKARLEALKNNQ